MTDTNELRKVAEIFREDSPVWCEAMITAADEIDRLRARVEELEATCVLAADSHVYVADKLGEECQQKGEEIDRLRDAIRNAWIALGADPDSDPACLADDVRDLMATVERLKMNSSESPNGS